MKTGVSILRYPVLLRRADLKRRDLSGSKNDPCVLFCFRFENGMSESFDLQKSALLHGSPRAIQTKKGEICFRFCFFHYIYNHNSTITSTKEPFLTNLQTQKP